MSASNPIDTATPGTDPVQGPILDFLAVRFPAATIDPDDDIFSLGFVNSLFAMELVMFLEQTFGFTAASDELRLENFRSVSAMTALVQAHRDRSGELA